MDQSSHQQLACRSYKGHSRGVDTWPWLKAPVSSSSRPRTSTEGFHAYKPSHHLKSHPTGQTVMSKSPPENNPYNVLHHRQRACKHQLASTISTEILVHKAILLRCVKFKQQSTISLKDMAAKGQAEVLHAFSMCCCHTCSCFCLFFGSSMFLLHPSSLKLLGFGA